MAKTLPACSPPSLSVSAWPRPFELIGIHFLPVRPGAHELWRRHDPIRDAVCRQAARGCNQRGQEHRADGRWPQRQNLERAHRPPQRRPPPQLDQHMNAVGVDPLRELARSLLLRVMAALLGLSLVGRRRVHPILPAHASQRRRRSPRPTASLHQRREGSSGQQHIARAVRAAVRSLRTAGGTHKAQPACAACAACAASCNSWPLCDTGCHLPRDGAPESFK